MLDGGSNPPTSTNEFYEISLVGVHWFRQRMEKMDAVRQAIGVNEAKQSKCKRKQLRIGSLTAD